MTIFTSEEIDPPADSDTLRALQEYRLREQLWGFAEATCARCKKYPGQPARHHGNTITRTCRQCHYVEVRKPKEIAR